MSISTVKYRDNSANEYDLGSPQLPWLHYDSNNWRIYGNPDKSIYINPDGY
jgi:hypothetical protein